MLYDLNGEKIGTVEQNAELIAKMQERALYLQGREQGDLFPLANHLSKYNLDFTKMSQDEQEFFLKEVDKAVYGEVTPEAVWDTMVKKFFIAGEKSDFISTVKEYTGKKKRKEKKDTGSKKNSNPRNSDNEGLSTTRDPLLPLFNTVSRKTDEEIRQEANKRTLEEKVGKGRAALVWAKLGWSQKEATSESFAKTLRHIEEKPLLSTDEYRYFPTVKALSLKYGFLKENGNPQLYTKDFESTVDERVEDANKRGKVQFAKHKRPQGGFFIFPTADSALS